MQPVWIHSGCTRTKGWLDEQASVASGSHYTPVHSPSRSWPRRFAPGAEGGGPVIRSVEQMPPQTQINSFTSLVEPERNNQLPPSGRSGIVPQQSGYTPAVCRARS
jgi:hypothetical protein